VEEAKFVFIKDIIDKKRTGMGAHGMTHGSRPKRPKLNVVSDPTDMIIHRADGVEIVIPAKWFTKTGKIRKAKLHEYKKLVGLY
jgi:hypothetical protein